jgi:hypothetical protein
MISAATSGGCGDIVYAIPVMKKLGVTRVYVKENWYKPPFHNLYSVMKDLLEKHGFEVLPTTGGFDSMQYEKGLEFDYDMDSFRQMRGRGRIHIMLNMYYRFGLPTSGWNKPWLEVTGVAPGAPTGEYSLIHLTPRWREGSQVNWERVFKSIEGPVYFIGFPVEHSEFCRFHGRLPYLPTENILQMAQLIRDCKALYCNQSVALTLAQGLGKKYYLAPKRNKTNTLLFTDKENILL